MSPRAPHTDPFRAVHRANRRRVFGFGVTGAFVAAMVLAATWVVPAAVAGPVPAVVEIVPVAAGTVDPAAAAPDTGAVADPTGVLPAPDAGTTAPAGASTIAAPQAGTLPEPAPGTVVTPAAPDTSQHPPASDPLAPPSAPVVYTIGVDTTGYQPELDECLWVRMDLAGASAPIVGAHNNCGGEIVLDVKPGDLVELSGQQLDGRYVAVDSRDGYPGQDAEEATAGFGATVILQTCYFEGPNVRLVALVRVA